MAVRPCEVPAMLATQLTLDDLTCEWQERLDSFPADVRERVAQTAERHRTDLASHFYGVMLAHKEAAQFLSHEEVKTRLSRSMENWITNLYNSSEAADIQSVIAHQTRIGEVHARVSIPVHLVLRGARLLKQRLITYLREELPERQAAEAAAFAATDRKSTRLNSSHVRISYAVFCLKKKKTKKNNHTT